MTPIIIAILVLVLVIFFFRYIAGKGGKILANQQQKQKRAKKAKAKILSHSAKGVTGMGYRGEYHTQKIQLEVYSENSSPYKVTTYWRVPYMHIPKVQPGLEVKVKIDAEDASVIYPNIEGIEYCFLSAQRINKINDGESNN